MNEIMFGGASLAQFAGVQAALAEGIALDEVLTQEQLDAGAWPGAERAWRQAIAISPALQLRLVHKQCEAEDALARRIEPLDDDPAAWMGLVGALARAPDMSSVLDPLGLRATDVGRLGRAWKKKAAEDPELGKRLVALAPTAVAPTSVRAEPAILRPFPWSPKSSAPVSASVPSVEASALESDADLFSALEAVIEALPDRKAEWLELCNVSAARYAEAAAAWRSRAQTSPDVRADLAVRLGDHRLNMRAILAGRVPVIS